MTKNSRKIPQKFATPPQKFATPPQDKIPGKNPAFNSIYSQLGYVYDISVLAHLLESIAVPMLIYAIEALDLTKSSLSNLDFPLNRALFKIFKLSSKGGRGGESLRIYTYFFSLHFTSKPVFLIRL